MRISDMPPSPVRFGNQAPLQQAGKALQDALQQAGIREVNLSYDRHLGPKGTVLVGIPVRRFDQLVGGVIRVLDGMGLPKVVAFNPYQGQDTTFRENAQGVRYLIIPDFAVSTL